MTWSELTLKERSKLYRQARAMSPDLTYFDIRDAFDMQIPKDQNVQTYSTGGVVEEPHQEACQGVQQRRRQSPSRAPALGAADRQQVRGTRNGGADLRRPSQAGRVLGRHRADPRPIVRPRWCS